MAEIEAAELLHVSYYKKCKLGVRLRSFFKPKYTNAITFGDGMLIQRLVILDKKAVVYDVVVLTSSPTESPLIPGGPVMSPHSGTA